MDNTLLFFFFPPLRTRSSWRHCLTCWLTHKTSSIIQRKTREKCSPNPSFASCGPKSWGSFVLKKKKKSCHKVPGFFHNKLKLETGPSYVFYQLTPAHSKVTCWTRGPHLMKRSQWKSDIFNWGSGTNHRSIWASSERN